MTDGQLRQHDDPDGRAGLRLHEPQFFRNLLERARDMKLPRVQIDI
jgi:hypothetical protein